MKVRRATIRSDTSSSGARRVIVRSLAGDAGRPSASAAQAAAAVAGAEAEAEPPSGGVESGASTFSPITIAHIELYGRDASHTVPIGEGWTCIVYVRDGAALVGGSVANKYDTVYLHREGGPLLLENAHDKVTDLMVFAGEPIGAPVVASGTMVMNSGHEVRQAMVDYERGMFGEPWDHRLSDEEWSRWCAERPL